MSPSPSQMASSETPSAELQAAPAQEAPVQGAPAQAAPQAAAVAAAHPEIPIIDLAALVSAERGSPAWRAAVADVAGQIRAACRDTGFFYVTGHGVPEALRQGVLDANRDFHAHADALKLPLKLNAWHRGYQPMASTHLKSSARFAPAPQPNQLESFIIREQVAEDDPAYKRKAFRGPNQWPAAPDFDPAFAAAFRRTLEDYFAATQALAMKLLPAFSVAVAEAPDFFDPHFAPPGATLRLVHYPPSPEDRPDDWQGIFPHTDYGFFTILLQDDVGGLQIQRVDGAWVDAPPIPGAFITNIADVLARWTNGVFNSSPHRVINKSTARDRYSVAMFFDPNHSAHISCIDSFLAPGEAPRHAPIRFADYYEERMNTNHPDRRAAD